MPQKRQGDNETADGKKDLDPEPETVDKPGPRKNVRNPGVEVPADAPADIIIQMQHEYRQDGQKTQTVDLLDKQFRIDGALDFLQDGLFPFILHKYLPDST